MTAAAALLLANTVDIESVSMMASAGFLIVFTTVNMANLWRADEIGSRRWLAALGVLACLVSLAMLLWHVAQTTPSQLLLLGGMLLIVVVIEVINMKAYGHHRSS